MAHRTSRRIELCILGVVLAISSVACRKDSTPATVASGWGRELSAAEAKAPRFVDIGVDGVLTFDGERLKLDEPRGAAEFARLAKGGTCLYLRIDPAAPLSVVSSSVETLQRVKADSSLNLPTYVCVSGADPLAPSIVPVPLIRAADEVLDAKGARILLYFVGTVPPEHDPARPWLVQLNAPGGRELPPPQPMDWAGVLTAAGSEPAQSGSLFVWTALPGSMPWSDFIPLLSTTSDLRPTLLDLRPLP